MRKIIELFLKEKKRYKSFGKNNPTPWKSCPGVMLRLKIVFLTKIRELNIKNLKNKIVKN